MSNGYSRSNKDHLQIVKDGYTYQHNYQVKVESSGGDKYKIYWKCRERECKGSAVTFRYDSDTENPTDFDFKANKDHSEEVAHKTFPLCRLWDPSTSWSQISFNSEGELYCDSQLSEVSFGITLPRLDSDSNIHTTEHDSESSLKMQQEILRLQEEKRIMAEKIKKLERSIANLNNMNQSKVRRVGEATFPSRHPATSRELSISTVIYSSTPSSSSASPSPPSSVCLNSSPSAAAAEAAASLASFSNSQLSSADFSPTYNTANTAIFPATHMSSINPNPHRSPLLYCKKLAVKRNYTQ